MQSDVLDSTPKEQKKKVSSTDIILPPLVIAPTVYISRTLFQLTHAFPAAWTVVYSQPFHLSLRCKE